MTTISIQYCPRIQLELHSSTSIPLKQYIQNGATNVCAGMPQKTGFADNTSTFSQGRNTFNKSSVCSIYLQDKNIPLQCNTGVIRVDSSDILSKNPNKWNPAISNTECIHNIESTCRKLYISNIDSETTDSYNTWSRSNHTIHNRNRSRNTCSTSSGGICLLNGKQNNIMTSQELISRRKNIAIGRGSKNTNNGLSFNDNNLNNSHTNYLSELNAKRTARNKGYVVPPKCRGQY